MAGDMAERLYAIARILCEGAGGTAPRAERFCIKLRP